MLLQTAGTEDMSGDIHRDGHRHGHTDSISHSRMLMTTITLITSDYDNEPTDGNILLMPTMLMIIMIRQSSTSASVFGARSSLGGRVLSHSGVRARQTGAQSKVRPLKGSPPVLADFHFLYVLLV